MAYFLDYLVLTFSLALSIGIAVPPTGVVIRLRANYNPKALQLDPKGNVDVHTGPIVTSFFGMFKRVYRIEGWAGFYKGLMPTAIASLAMTGFGIVASMGSKELAGHGPAAFVQIMFGTLVTLPATVLTYRSIVTPYRLPYFRPIYSLRILLTPTERRRPWMLYLTPGLVTAQVLRIAYTSVILYGLRRLLLPVNTFSPARFGVYVAIEMFSTAITCPLEVIATRLAIQRNHSAVEYDSEVKDDPVEAPEYAEYSGQEEDVIGLRHEKDPYLGFADCVKRIIDEEGWQTLYRAWCVTMFGAILSAFGAGAMAVQPVVAVGGN